jgi:CubicO group peptidase (beta-lactamase class C family)
MNNYRKLSFGAGVLLAGLGLGNSAPLFAAEASLVQVGRHTIPVTELDSKVSQLMNAAHVTGLGLAVLHEGKIVYLKAHGVRDRKDGARLTEHSSMCGASLAKAIFAAVVMQLVEEGVLDLDQPVERALGQSLGEFPDYRDLRGDERTQRFTLRMLLDHTSGLPNWRTFMPEKKLAIHFEPGSRYSYSGEGIAIAQLVVEKVTGKDTTTLMQERIFGPFAMPRTSMVWRPAFESDLAVGHDEQEKPLGHRKRTKAGAAGSMDTCLEDYTKFIEALLQDRVMKKESLAEMTRPQVEIFSKAQFPTLSTETTDENRAVGLAYGLGWGVLQRTSHGPAFFKEGHDDGWEHYSICYPASKSAVIIMTNSSNGESIFKQLLEIVTGDQSFPWRWEGCTPYDLSKEVR